jgi:hypothetical protein
MSALQPVGEEFFDSAHSRYSQQWIIDQPAAAVWAELTGDKPLHWCRALDISWTSPRPFSVGTTRQAKVLGGILRVQEHFFLWEEGQRHAFYVTQANAPLFASLAEDYTVEPVADDRCAFTWTIAFTPTALGRAGSAANGPLFNSFFADTAKYFAAAPVRSR